MSVFLNSLLRIRFMYFIIRLKCFSRKFCYKSILSEQEIDYIKIVITEEWKFLSIKLFGKLEYPLYMSERFNNWRIFQFFTILSFIQLCVKHYKRFTLVCDF